MFNNDNIVYLIEKNGEVIKETSNQKEIEQYILKGGYKVTACNPNQKKYKIL